MAQDIVGSLFGPAVGDVLQQRVASESADAAQFANLTPQQQAQYGMYMAGRMGGRAVSGLLGAEDPRLVQAKQMQQVKQWIAQSGIDMNTPEGLAQAAQYAQSIGAVEGAMYLGQQAQTMRSSSSKMQLEQAQAYSALKKADAEKLSNYGRILVDSGFTPGTPEFINQMQKFAAAELQGTSNRGNTVIVTPDSGKVKPSDIQTTINTRKDVLGDTGDILDNIGIARASLQGASTNPTSANQSYKSVAMVLKDKLLSNKDVRESLGKRGLLGKAEQTVESLMSGTLSPQVIKDANSYLNDIEKTIAPKYNKKVNDFNALVDESNYAEKTRNSLYATPYTPAAPKGKLGGSLVPGANGVLEYRKPQQ